MNNDKCWYVYFLLCKGDRIYTGCTNNLEKRLTVHNKGKGSKFVKAFLPFTLITHINNLTKSEAMKLEYEVKKLSRSEKIKFLTTINNCDIINNE